MGFYFLNISIAQLGLAPIHLDRADPQIHT